MGIGKNYSVKANLSPEDEPAIDALLKKHPLWKRRHAREAVARANFQKRITAATPAADVFEKIEPLSPVDVKVEAEIVTCASAWHADRFRRELDRAIQRAGGAA